MKIQAVLSLLFTVSSAATIDIHIDSDKGGLDTNIGGCYWDGTAPFCNGGCSSGYTECNKSYDGDGATCQTGYKVFCCKDSCPSSVHGSQKSVKDIQVESDKTVVDTNVGACYWDGSAPFCNGGCSSGYTECNKSYNGDGATCHTGYKVLCCKGSCSSSILTQQKPLDVGATGKTQKGHQGNDKPVYHVKDHDDVCGEHKSICCPLFATNNEECTCVKDLGIQKGARMSTVDEPDNDFCAEGEKMCCAPGATTNNQCRCVSGDKFKNLEL